MGLNIKNEAVELSIRNLANLTGQGLTEAVGAAVAEKLERLGRERDRDARFHRIMEIGRQAAAEADPPFNPGEDPTAYLYDPVTGLPR